MAVQLVVCLILNMYLLTHSCYGGLRFEDKRVLDSQAISSSFPEQGTITLCYTV